LEGEAARAMTGLPSMTPMETTQSG